MKGDWKIICPFFYRHGFFSILRKKGETNPDIRPNYLSTKKLFLMVVLFQHFFTHKSVIY